MENGEFFSVSLTLLFMVSLPVFHLSFNAGKSRNVSLGSSTENGAIKAFYVDIIIFIPKNFRFKEKVLLKPSRLIRYFYF